MQGRPISLSILGWLFIVFGAWGIIGVFIIGDAAYEMAGEFTSLTPTMSKLLNIVGGIISMVCGVGVLKGVNAARLVFMGWSIIQMVVAFATTKLFATTFIGLAFVALYAFFLFRPAADRWFGKSYLSKE